jgi:hypothetical protein
MHSTVSLTPGLTWQRGNQECLLVRITGSGNMLRGLVRRGREYEDVRLVELAQEVVTALWATNPELRERADDDRLLANLSDDAHRKMRRRLRAVLEVLTGLPDPATAGPGRREYDFTQTTQAQRVASKADEEGKSERTINRWIEAFEKDGQAGLVHGNTQVDDPLRGYDEDTIEIARTFVETEMLRSQKKQKNLTGLLNKQLRARGCDTLSVYRANRLLAELTRGSNLQSPGKTRKSKASRSPGSGGYIRPTVANEVWEVDCTPLDLLVYSPVTGDGVPAHSITVIDQCTKTLSIYVTLNTPTATTVAIALHRRMNPLCLDPSTAPMGPAIPEWLSTPEDGVLVHPGGIPGEVHSDHGREWENDVVNGLLTSLGIDLILTRPRTGDDKPHVETANRTINHAVIELLPGYKGHTTDGRGAQPHKEQLATLEQLQAIADGYCLAYNNQPHSGLPHPARLGTFVTPMESYADSILAGVPLRVDPDINFLFRFLPTKNAVVTGRGPTVDGIVYHGDAVPLMRTLSAGDRFVRGRPLTFHYDPNNRSTMWWHEPGTARWHTLSAIGRYDEVIPALSDQSYQNAEKRSGRRRPNKQDAADLALSLAEYVHYMLNEKAGQAELRKEFNRYQQQLRQFCNPYLSSTPSTPTRTTGSTRKKDLAREQPAGPVWPAVFDFDLDAYVEEIDDDMEVGA